MVAPYTAPMPHGGLRSYGGTPTWGVWNKQDARFIYVYKGKTYKMSRLVCEAFNGAPPFPGAVAMHENENSADNRASNLAWGTQKENLNAPGFIEYCEARVGEHNPQVIGMLRRAAVIGES